MLLLENHKQHSVLGGHSSSMAGLGSEVLSASVACPGVYEGIWLLCHMIFNSYDFKTLSHLYSRSNVAAAADGS